MWLIQTVYFHFTLHHVAYTIPLCNDYLVHVHVIKLYTIKILTFNNEMNDMFGSLERYTPSPQGEGSTLYAG